MPKPPSTNIQAPKKLCSSETLRTKNCAVLIWFEVWCFSGAWSLDVGAFLRRRMPAGVGPERTADCGVGNHKTNCIGNFLGLNQTAQLRSRNNVFADEFSAETANHWRVGI